MQWYISGGNPRSFKRRLKFWLNSIVAMLCLSGCTVGPEPVPDDPYYAPIFPKTPVGKHSSVGSLYQPGVGISLFNDRRAARVGDIITVLLDEQTSSSKTAETSVDKESKVDIGADTVLSTTPTLKNLAFPTSIDQSREFKGEGESGQSNNLQGSIAVTVAEELPNGMLVVRGEKWLTLNRGDEYIRLRGIIRQEDISATNTVSSGKIADARITYSGTGEVADANNMGWGTRFFNSRFWPF